MKIISISILLFISFQVCGQDVITIEMLKKKTRYYYNGIRAKPNKLRDIIYNSGDAMAKKHFSNYRTKTTIGWSLVLTGSVLVTVGAFRIAEKESCNIGVQIVNGIFGTQYYCPKTYGGIWLGAGILIGNVGALILHSGKSDLESSVAFYNHGFINRNGIGLRYNF